MIVTVLPATVAVPLRFDEPVFDETWTVTVPLPVPERPDTIVIQPAVDEAVHVQAEAVLTLNVVVPPAPATVTLVGLTV